MDETEPIKRMHYFDRQFLRAADFQDEQKYHLRRRWLHNKLLHTAGPTTHPNGLMVKGNQGDTRVLVDSGVAIDEDGREIVLLKEREVPFPATLGAGTHAIVIVYDDTETDKSNDPGGQGNTRVSDSPLFEFKKLEGARAPLPPLTLAVIVIGDDKTLAASPDNSQRTPAGTKVGSATFEAVTATGLTLRDAGGNRTVQVTSDGGIASPMWSVVLSEKRLAESTIEPEALIKELSFPTKGGDLLIFAAGSVSLPSGTTPSENGIAFGINIFLDSSESPIGGEPSVPGCAKPGHLHTAVTTTLFAPGGRPPTRTLRLKAAKNTKLFRNDFYSVTILELPFNKRIG